MARKPIRISDVLGFAAAPQRDLTKGYQREVRSIPRGQKYQGLITRARPTAAQELAQLLTPNTRGGAELADRLTPALENIPLLGGLLSLVDARRQYNAGNTGQAAGLGILAALGAVPGAAGARATKEAAETAAERGIIAYHGSPYSFDRFSLSKIGTGEGAQAYGHGLYFAEAEDVARSYRDDLLSRNKNFSGFNMRVNETPIEKIYSQIEKRAENLSGKKAADEYDKLSAIESLMIYGDPKGVIGSGQVEGDALDWFKKEIAPNFKRDGSMYQVRINANPEQFMEWDKPLSEQQVIKDYVNNYNALVGKEEIDPTMAGADFYHYVRRQMQKKYNPNNELRVGNYGKEVADYLLSQGVKGIKYLDQGSRGAGEGSRNYVVFDDALIDILKKYGIAIPAIAGGGLLATQPQQDGGL